MKLAVLPSLILGALATPIENNVLVKLAGPPNGLNGLERNTGRSIPITSLENHVHVKRVPIPTGFRIVSGSTAGTGCPAGSSDFTLSGESCMVPVYVLTDRYLRIVDRSKIDINYSRFGTQAGPGIPSSSNRKICQLSLGVSIPSGFAFALSEVWYQTSYQFSGRVAGYHNAEYYFSEDLQQKYSSGEVNGPMPAGNYTFSDYYGSPRAFSECNIPGTIDQ
jgi:hypothetical protein